MYTIGESPSQGAIDNAISMAFGNIPNYVNSWQTENEYVKMDKSDSWLRDLTTCIRYDIETEEVPTFMRLSGTTEDTWYYSTSGHCVLASGIYDDLSWVQIADPYGGRVEDCPCFYEKRISGITDYVTHVCW